MTILRDYPALIALADELHFGRAAERLGISQPQLSETIKRVESRSRVRIFERRPAVRLTPAGEVLVSSARQAIDEAESGVARARAVAAGAAGTVRFGFSPISLLTPLGRSLQSFGIANPEIELKLIERHSGALMEELKRRRVDLAVSRQRPDDRDAQTLEIHREPMVLVLPELHPLARQDTVSVAQLRDEPLALWSREAAPEYFDEVRRAFEAESFEPRIVQTVNGWSSLLALVAAGFGLAIVSTSVSRLVFPGIVYRRIEDFSARATFWMSWHPEWIPSAADRLREAIETDAKLSG